MSKFKMKSFAAQKSAPHVYRPGSKGATALLALLAPEGASPEHLAFACRDGIAYSVMYAWQNQLAMSYYAPLGFSCVCERVGKPESFWADLPEAPGVDGKGQPIAYRPSASAERDKHGNIMTVVAKLIPAPGPCTGARDAAQELAIIVAQAHEYGRAHVEAIYSPERVKQALGQKRPSGTERGKAALAAYKPAAAPAAAEAPKTDKPKAPRKAKAKPEAAHTAVGSDVTASAAQSEQAEVEAAVVGIHNAIADAVGE